MSNSKPTLEHTIYTIAVVGRVRWRPERKFHIASCALVVDYSIYIWDIRRPFIPYASFNQHTNVTTDIAFKGVPDCLISTSKDSTIYKHNTKNGQHIAQTANPQSTSINLKGEILFVCKAKIKQTPLTASTSAMKASLNQILPLAKKIIPSDAVDSAFPVITEGSDHFHMAKSSLHFFPDSAECSMSAGVDVALTKTLHKDFQFFLKCAQEYKLKATSAGEFLENLDHNAKVASKRPSISMLWGLVKNAYNFHKSIPPRPTHYNTQNSNQSNDLINISGSALINHPVSSENISTHEETTNESNEIVATNWTTPKVATSDFEVEVYDENLIQNQVDSKQLRSGFLFTGPHNDFIKDFPMCSSSVLSHELMKNYQNDQLESQEVAENGDNVIHSFLSTPGYEMTQIQIWKPFQVLADSLILQSEIGDVQVRKLLSCAIPM